jgi:hypothetical protein
MIKKFLYEFKFGRKLTVCIISQLKQGSTSHQPKYNKPLVPIFSKIFLPQRTQRVFTKNT